MFKKTILTISALAFSAGMLVSASSTDVEARKYKSRYKKTQSINFSGDVPRYHYKGLCKLYGCPSLGIPKGGDGGKPAEPATKKQINTPDGVSAYFTAKEKDANGNTKELFGRIRNLDGVWAVKAGGSGFQETSKFGNRVRIANATWVASYTNARRKGRHYRKGRKYYPTRYRGRISSRRAKRACLRSRRCRAAAHRLGRKLARRNARKARYIPTRYKRKLALKKRRALKRRRALRKSRYNVTRYKRKLAKRRALKRRRVLRKRRALRRSKYKRTSYRGRRHLRRRARR